ncbi:hypothetical protein QUB70_24705, partial [Microcoleus sp. A003_D6]|uniref:hypothetical protein n=1 Tax=Microcoleus sp. A003_D6 TaxID=3055266 RepID=UPI002FD2707E
KYYAPESCVSCHQSRFVVIQFERSFEGKHKTSSQGLTMENFSKLFGTLVKLPAIYHFDRESVGSQP